MPVWSLDQTLISPLPLFCVCLRFMPFALHCKWLFQGIVLKGRETILHGKRKNCYYLDSREATNLPHRHACPCCILTRDLGSSLCTAATWGPHLSMLLYGYLFPENSGTRRLGKDSAKHAVKPKPRSWNRHLHGGSGQTPLTLCPVPRDPTSQTHRSWAWPDVMRWYRVRILCDIKMTVPMQMLLDTVNVSLSLFSPVLSSTLSCMCSPDRKSVV